MWSIGLSEGSDRRGGARTQPSFIRVAGNAVAQDPYKELGVSRTSSPDEIRKTFRKLAKTLHPDQNPGDKAAEERFKRVSGAFDILGDPEKKARFDRGEIDADGNELSRGYAGGGGRSGGPWSGADPRAGAAGGFSSRFEGIDLDEILGGFNRAGGGGAGPRGFNAGRGGDIRATLEIDLEDAIRGATRRISFGDGRSLDVTIPKGAAEGQVLRLRGQGQPGRGSGQAGDALIELTIKAHPRYRLEGADLHMDLPVAVPDAVLGAKVQAPTPEGEVSLRVPKGANAGSVLRLKGRGGATPAGGRGDLFAHLVIVLPDQPDEDLIRFAEEWREQRPYTPKLR